MEILSNKVKAPLAIIVASIGLAACGNENNNIETSKESAGDNLRIIDLEHSYELGPRLNSFCDGPDLVDVFIRSNKFESGGSAARTPDHPACKTGKIDLTYFEK